MRIKFVFDSGNAGGLVLLISMIAVLLTFVFALLALPRWQAFVGLGISTYAAYWLATAQLYGVA